MTSRPHTDINILVREEVVAHMRAFIQTSFLEHESTRNEIRGAVKIMKLAAANRVLILFLGLIDVLELAAIIILYIK